MNFDFFGHLFQLFLYQPLLNLLVLTYSLLPNRDLGLSVIILVLGMRILTFPLNRQVFTGSQALAKIQPQLREIQEKYRNQPGEQARLLSAIFQKEKINPWSNFLPLLIQLPILIALYRLFWQGLWQLEPQLLYGFVPQIEDLNPWFLNLVDLSQPSLFLALLAGLAQFFQSSIVSFSPQSNPVKQSLAAQILQKEMLFLFPVLTFFILAKLPSALGLYWSLSSLLAVGEQFLLRKLS